MTTQSITADDVVPVLQQAKKLHMEGHPEKAIPLYLQALQSRPQDPMLLDLIGMVYLENQKPQEAVRYFDQAIALLPQGENFHLHRGNAHQALGHYQEALNDYQIAAQLKPQDPAPWINSIGPYHKIGQLAEAERIGRIAVQKAPMLAESWHNLAHVLYAEGKFAEAASCARKATEISPQEAMPWFTLADALRAQNLNTEAEAAFKKALSINPNMIPAMINLANLYGSVGRYNEAIRLYEQVLSIDPQQPEASANLGGTLVEVGREEEAERWLQGIVDTGQHTPYHIAGLAYALRASGKIDAAVATVSAHLEEVKQPNHSVAAVWAELALDRPEVRTRAIADLHHWLDTAGLSAPLPHRAEILLRLASLYDKERQPRAAFQAAQKAKALFGIRSDPGLEQTLASRIEQAFTAQRLRMPPYGMADEMRPVFIVGMPRSGTSLLEQMLAAHPDVHGGGEIEEMGLIAHELSGADPVAWPSRVTKLDEYSLQALALRWLHPLVQASPGSLRFTDKMPHNFTYIGMIYLLFPKARIIHIRRDPRDVALSIFFHHFTGHHPYAYHLQDIAQHYRFYERLMNHWRQALPTPMLEIHYERLTTDPKTQIQRVLDYIGLPWSDQVLEFHKERRAVLTASRYQVKEPIHRRAQGRWCSYRKELHLFLETNRDIIEAYERSLESGEQSS